MRNSAITADTKDIILALESAEKWLEKGYRVRIRTRVNMFAEAYVRMDVFQRGLHIIVTHFQSGQSTPGIVHT